MPDKTITFLSATAGGLLALYLILVVTTISFAAWRTDLAQSMHTTESSIARLESTYYQTMSTLAAVSPSSVGLVAPVATQYAVREAAPTLTLR